MITIKYLIVTCFFLVSSCEKEKLLYENGDVEIEIKTGDKWLHDFPLLMGLTKKNPPQFAIWIEDTSGNYLSTVFVTYKIATEGWKANKGNRRKESLPHWCHQRGIKYADGLLLPTKDNVLADGITGETPKADKTIKIQPVNLEKPFVVKAEFNHSVDYNNFYSDNLDKGDEFYSGGEGGSGQPAVVYATTVYPNTNNTVLELIGHSSVDGTTGTINPDVQKLTTALSIVESIHLTIK